MASLGKARDAHLLAFASYRLIDLETRRKRGKVTPKKGTLCSGEDWITPDGDAHHPDLSPRRTRTARQHEEAMSQGDNTPPCI